MNPLMNIAIEAARAAGRQVLKAFARPDLMKMTIKGDRDFATDADVKAEQLIIEMIHKAYPKHAILSEEIGQMGENETRWIIDPIDGTRNFAHSFPHFCISIAVRVNNKVEHGVIYDPLRDELFTTSAGRGAQLNDRRIRCVQRPLEQSIISFSYPMPTKAEALDLAAKVATLTPVVGAMRYTGSLALELAYLAAGRLDACLVYRSKIWDYAAGLLLIQEAGGLVTDWAGGENYQEQGQFITAHPKFFKPLLKAIG
jgi:myo-inositol-1(or 4)-monophosphatase